LFVAAQDPQPHITSPPPWQGQHYILGITPGRDRLPGHPTGPIGDPHPGKQTHHTGTAPHTLTGPQTPPQAVPHAPYPHITPQLSNTHVPFTPSPSPTLFGTRWDRQRPTPVPSAVGCNTHFPAPCPLSLLPARPTHTRPHADTRTLHTRVCCTYCAPVQGPRFPTHHTHPTPTHTRTPHYGPPHWTTRVGLGRVGNLRT